MSRASSRRAAIESRMPRIICAEIAMRPMRSRSRTAIGASSTGGGPTPRPGAAAPQAFPHVTPRESGGAWADTRPMSTADTPRDTAVTPGMAGKRGPDLLVEHDHDERAQNQEHQHPDEKNPGRGELEGIDVLRHGEGITPPSNSPHNKAAARRKEEPARFRGPRRSGSPGGASRT